MPYRLLVMSCFLDMMFLQFLLSICSHSQLGLSKYYLKMHNWFINIFCFLQMLDASQTLLPADELKKRFEQEGMDS